MDLKILFFTTASFLTIYFIFRKFDLLKDDISYSPHKILGSENKSPIIIGGPYIFLIITIFYPIISFNMYSILTLIILLGILSDKNILSNPKIRLIFQVILLFILVYLEDLKINDLRNDFINMLLSNKFFNILFTVFCLAILLNGSNFLDGLNGLLTGYYLMIIVSLLILNNLIGSTIIINHTFLELMICVLMIFLTFNIFGFVYLGDSGTYAVALLVGTYLIKFYLLNIFISPFYIAVLLWYPAFENLFSLSRRIIGKRNVSDADNYHLHQLTFLFFKSKKTFSKRKLNTISAMLILLFNVPGLLISNFYATKSLILIFILILNIILYLFFYYILSQNFAVKK